MVVLVEKQATKTRFSVLFL